MDCSDHSRGFDQAFLHIRRRNWIARRCRRRPCIAASRAAGRTFESADCCLPWPFAADVEQRTTIGATDRWFQFRNDLNCTNFGSTRDRTTWPRRTEQVPDVLILSQTSADFRDQMLHSLIRFHSTKLVGGRGSFPASQTRDKVVFRNRSTIMTFSAWSFSLSRNSSRVKRSASGPRLR